MTSHLTPVDELPADADDQADDEPELTVPFCGEEWRISNRKIGLMHMMRYARATKRGMELAQSGVEPDGMIEMEILTATLDLLEQCVHSEEWSRFVLVTADAGADQDDYMNFAGEVMALRARRPTGRSTASSDGPPTTSSTSAAGSSSPDMSPEARRQIDRLNGMGRPEFAQMVRQAEESRSA